MSHVKQIQCLPIPFGIQSVVLRYFNVFGERMSNKWAYKSVISIFRECEENN